MVLFEEKIPNRGALPHMAATSHTWLFPFKRFIFNKTASFAPHAGSVSSAQYCGWPGATVFGPTDTSPSTTAESSTGQVLMESAEGEWAQQTQPCGRSSLSRGPRGGSSRLLRQREHQLLSPYFVSSTAHKDSLLGGKGGGLGSGLLRPQSSAATSLS